jgi:hypothetical protein
VVFEHLDKSLPDDARGTENSYGNFFDMIKLRFYTSEISAGNAAVGTHVGHGQVEREFSA